MIRRVFDIIVSFSLLLALSPLWIGVAIALLFLYRGKRIIFSQQRIGLHGDTFVLYKFRTLRLEQTGIGHGKNDLTSAGKILRRYSLDEIPQLINIMKGEMSVIGPRPLPLEYKSAILSNYPWRLAMKPGITGLVQVSGRNSLNWERRFEKDRWYYKNRSMLLDLKIFFMTAVVVAKGGGDVESDNLLSSQC